MAASKPFVSAIAVVILTGAPVPRAIAGGFQWDGECGFNWFDCCELGPGNYANNWTIEHTPTPCPAYPTTDDSVATGDYTVLNAQAGARTVGVSGMGAVFELDPGAWLSIKESISVGGLFSEIKFYGAFVNLFEAGGTFNTSTLTQIEFAAGGIIYNGALDGTVENYGLITSSGPGTASIYPAVHNFGTVRPDAGVINLFGGGTSAGLLDTSEDTQLNLEFPGKTFTILDGSQVRGHGLLTIASGTVINQGDFGTQGIMRVTGGSGGSGTLQFDVDGAANRFEENMGLFTGDGDMNTDHLTWTGGGMSGAGATIAHVDAAIGSTVLLDRELQFAAGCNATMDAGGSGLYMEPNGWVLNSGTLHLHDFIIGEYSPQTDQRVVNEGALLKDAGSGPATVSVPVYSTGTIDVTAGALTLAHPGQDSGYFSGSIHVGPGGSLVLASNQQGYDPGHYYIFDGTKPTGEGTIDFTYSTTQIGGSWGFPGTTHVENGGTASFDHYWTAGTLNIGGGTVTGPSNFTVNDHFVWAGGTISSTGPNPYVLGSILGDTQVSSYCTLDRPLDLAGDATLNGSIFMTANGRVFNHGTMTLVTGGVSTNDAPAGSFVNLGTIIRNGGTNGAGFNNCFTSSGTVLCQSGWLTSSPNYTQTAGATILAGGGLAAGAVNINGGTLRGSGTLAVDSLHNNSVVEPGNPIGEIDLTVNNYAAQYFQSAGGLLKIQLAGTGSGQYDVLHAMSAAHLAGALHISTVDGFVPQPGQQFTIITAPTVDGQFDSVNDCHYNVIYTPNSVIVVVLSTPKPGDINCDGVVNVDDLLAVINAWGLCPAPPAPGPAPAPGLPADIAPPPDGDGVVNVDDLLMVINNWG